MEISISVMSAIWIKLPMLCGHMNTFSMSYSGVSDAERWETVNNGNETKMFQHMVFILFEYSKMENSIDPLARGAVLSPRSAQRRDIMPLLIKHNSRLSFVAPLVCWCHFVVVVLTKMISKEHTFRLWNCHQSSWSNNLDLVLENTSFSVDNHFCKASCCLSL